MLMKDIINCKDLFVGLDTLVPNPNGENVRYINFDNAATTPPFKEELKVLENYMNYYSSIGRGNGYKAKISTDIYEESRNRVKKFFNIDKNDSYTVIYGMNTTGCMNLLANTLIDDKKDIIIATRMEHHSNDLPWRRVGTVKYVEVDEKGKLKLDQFETLAKKYADRLKVITVSGASNVTGYINDINYVARIAHKYGAMMVVDGAQLVPHRKINLNKKNFDEEIDYLVFSAHKMYAPFGTGVIVGKKNPFIKKDSSMPGGGTVDIVGHDRVFWLDPPEKVEGGTQNIVGVLALMISMDEIEKIGFDLMEKQESLLRDHFTEEIKGMQNIKLYYDTDEKNRLGVCGFNIEGIYHEVLAEYLGKDCSIGIRDGCFCAQPYVKKILGIRDQDTFVLAYDKTLKSPGIVRVSFAPYNTISEVDYCLECINKFISKKR